MDADNASLPKNIGGHTTNNPAPLIDANGTMLLLYRNRDSRVGPCSLEAVLATTCTRFDSGCPNGPNCNCTASSLALQHTAEDPGVFRDARGHYHLLANMMPGKCEPKTAQGGHAWSLDGLSWSAPRMGAFNSTVAFRSSGAERLLGRRERPKVSTAPDGTPLVLWTAVCETEKCDVSDPAGTGLGIWTMAQRFRGSPPVPPPPPPPGPSPHRWGEPQRCTSCERSPALADLGKEYGDVAACEAACEQKATCRYVNFAEITDRHCVLYAACNDPLRRPDKCAAVPNAWWTTYALIPDAATPQP